MHVLAQVGALLASLAMLAIGRATVPEPPRITPPPLVLGIPAGTYAAELRGEPMAFPSTIRLAVGQQLVVTNNDQAIHYIANHAVLPNRTITASFATVGEYRFSGGQSCSLNRSGGVLILVEPAPSQ